VVQAQEDVAVRRPNPIWWTWYALGGGLPPRYSAWVLHDTTTRTWALRHLVRALVQLAIPIAAVLVFMPGEFWIRGMAALVRARADDLCEGRLALVLEGGYAASGQREGTAAVLEALLPEAPLPPHPPVNSGTSRTLDELVDRVAAVHRTRYPDLGAA